MQLALDVLFEMDMEADMKLSAARLLYSSVSLSEEFCGVPRVARLRWLETKLDPRMERGTASGGRR